LLDGTHGAAVARIGQALQGHAQKIRLTLLAQARSKHAADDLQVGMPGSSVPALRAVPGVRRVGRPHGNAQ
jgi:hypothetical protein